MESANGLAIEDRPSLVRYDGGAADVHCCYGCCSLMADSYKSARNDHACFLRSEGATYEQIGRRLGISKERARQLVVIEQHRRAGLKRGWAGWEPDTKAAVH